ncbi:MAG TPA: hypothetical protein VF294_14705, partial [Polyangiaceae bacterium]
MSPRKLAWAALPLAALLVYCEARQVPEGPKPKAPPFRVAPAPSASPPVPSAVFSLSDFRPLLTLPSLSAVSSALDAGTPAAAARELDNQLEKSPAPPEQRFRYDFLLARLYEQGSQFAPALAAYARVSAGTSELTNYARVAEARMLLALGRAKEVEARLAGVPEDEPVARLKWPVLADAARLRGDRSAAIAAYGHVLAVTPASSDRTEYELRLATTLVEPSAPGNADHSGELVQALDLSRQIQNQPNAPRATLTAAQTLEARALAALPEALRSEHAQRSAADRLEQARALFDARRFSDARASVDETLSALPEAEHKGGVGCELQFLLGKALASTRAYDRAGDVFEALLNQCSDADLRARAQFMAGKAAASDGQHMLAVKRFAAL